MDDDLRIPQAYETVFGGTTVEVLEETLRRMERARVEIDAAEARGDESTAKATRAQLLSDSKSAIHWTETELARQRELEEELESRDH
jgi:hypothetical protein